MESLAGGEDSLVQRTDDRFLRSIELFGSAVSCGVTAIWVIQTSITQDASPAGCQAESAPENLDSSGSRLVLNGRQRQGLTMAFVVPRVSFSGIDRQPGSSLRSPDVQAPRLQIVFAGITLTTLSGEFSLRPAPAML